MDQKNEARYNQFIRHQQERIREGERNGDMDKIENARSLILMALSCYEDNMEWDSA